MRQRTRLDTTLSGFRALEREMTENVELIELGEAEDDDDVRFLRCGCGLQSPD